MGFLQQCLQVQQAMGQHVLAGFTLQPAVLASCGNALLIPRALQLHNGMFLTATSWGACMWWFVVAAILAAHKAGCGAWAMYGSATATLILYVWASLRCYGAFQSSQIFVNVREGTPAAPWFVAPPVMK